MHGDVYNRACSYIYTILYEINVPYNSLKKKKKERKGLNDTSLDRTDTSLTGQQRIKRLVNDTSLDRTEQQLSHLLKVGMMVLSS